MTIDSACRERRRLLVALACLPAAAVPALAPPLRAAVPSADEIAFKVFRNGEPLGHHRVGFRRESGNLHVEIDIELEVKLAFLTVFRYRHSNREVWRDGRLIAIDTKTDDDGEHYRLRGRRSGRNFAVEGSSGVFSAPSDIIPTSYWNPSTVKQSTLLDTQRGRLINVDIAPAGRETIALGTVPVSTERYRVTGDLTLDLWYTADGEWAKTSFTARGSEVEYSRQASFERSASLRSAISQ